MPAGVNFGFCDTDTVGSLDIAETQSSTVCQRYRQISVCGDSHIGNTDAVFTVLTVNTVLAVGTRRSGIALDSVDTVLSILTILTVNTVDAVTSVFAVLSDNTTEIDTTVVRERQLKLAVVSDFYICNADTVRSVYTVSAVGTCRTCIALVAFFALFTLIALGSVDAVFTIGSVNAVNAVNAVDAVTAVFSILTVNTVFANNLSEIFFGIV